jgi:hypothetical protein
MRTSVEWRTLQIAKSFGDNNLSFQLSNLTYPPLETISPMGKFLSLPPARVVENLPISRKRATQRKHVKVLNRNSCFIIDRSFKQKFSSPSNFLIYFALARDNEFRLKTIQTLRRIASPSRFHVYITDRIYYFIFCGHL